MIGFLFRPLLPWLVRRLLALLLQAVGRDLRERLPEVFEAVDQQILPAMLRGASGVSLLFFTTVQQVVKRDPTELEQRILRLVFDPAIAAERIAATSEQP